MVFKSQFDQNNMKIENIKKQILDRIYLKNLSISSLERKAGLKKGTARNIVSNISQNPTIDTLAAIASVLDCKVDDLISTTTLANIPPVIEEDYGFVVSLFTETTRCSVEYIEKKSINISLNNAIQAIKEAYIFFLTKKSSKIDQEFIEWVIEKNKTN
jgi:transcriptional regulator with XRE-family HTH domain